MLLWCLLVLPNSVPFNGVFFGLSTVQLSAGRLEPPLILEVFSVGLRVDVESGYYISSCVDELPVRYKELSSTSHGENYF